MNNEQYKLPTALADGLKGSHPVLGFSPTITMHGWRAEAPILEKTLFYPSAEAGGNFQFSTFNFQLKRPAGTITFFDQRQFEHIKSAQLQCRQPFLINN